MVFRKLDKCSYRRLSVTLVRRTLNECLGQKSNCEPDLCWKFSRNRKCVQPSIACRTAALLPYNSHVSQETETVFPCRRTHEHMCQKTAKQAAIQLTSSPGPKHACEGCIDAILINYCAGEPGSVEVADGAGRCPCRHESKPCKARLFGFTFGVNTRRSIYCL